MTYSLLASCIRQYPTYSSLCSKLLLKRGYPHMRPSTILSSTPNLQLLPISLLPLTILVISNSSNRLNRFDHCPSYIILFFINQKQSTVIVLIWYCVDTYIRLILNLINRNNSIINKFKSFCVCIYHSFNCLMFIS